VGAENIDSFSHVTVWHVTGFTLSYGPVILIYLLFPEV
jgi:hypothetical protein